jgi:DNA-binding NarL/FixJ family response regulator
MLKIVIADDHALIREGIKKIVNEEPDLKLVGETSNPFEVVDLCKNTQADIIVLDISMPGKSGLDVLKEIKTLSPSTKVLMMTMLPEDQFAKRALKAGASGYITKDNQPEEILKAIRKVSSGKKYISQSFAENLIDDLGGDKDKPLIEVLSDREFQIFKLIAEGKPQTDIANELFISISTVNTYRKRIFDKLGFKSNADLIHFAIKNKLIE